MECEVYGCSETGHHPVFVWSFGQYWKVLDVCNHHWVIDADHGYSYWVPSVDKTRSEQDEARLGAQSVVPKFVETGVPMPFRMLWYKRPFGVTRSEFRNSKRNALRGVCSDGKARHVNGKLMSPALTLVYAPGVDRVADEDLTSC